ncbi:hypothetical protein BC835DRAFT_1278780 [Cytidiella melzeri]|nr:hypothetical protein BC835DRAFT_1278780 [Cytidiella melzeri]
MGTTANTLLPAFVVSKPARVFTTVSFIFAFFSLTPTPAFIAIVALLTVLRLSAQTFVNRKNGYLKGAAQAVLISIAAGAAHLAPSMEALSTPNVALAVFSGISLLASSVAVAIIYASVHLSKPFGSAWSQITLFPALWASTWGFVSQVSPVGQLVTWSPVLGLGPYSWTRQILGQWGVDWIAAAWAVIASEVLGDWLIGASAGQESLIDMEGPLIDHEENASYGAVARPQTNSATPRYHSRSITLSSLFTILVLIMIPTYFTPSLPAPRNADNSTPLSVACALPDPRFLKHNNPTFEDYLMATKQLQDQANMIFWPESAVKFETPDDRTAAFAKIQDATQGGKLIGVSFEEFVSNEGKHRNGFALLGPSGPPVLEYYKRNLVPIAESFSLTPGHTAPEIYTIELKKPFKGRTVPVTAGICLDFASASSFTSLEFRPALILAPARTWHIGVGLAMWEQAKARAAETGSTVVWCDGGKGGISGIATGAYSEIVQVGPGSWVKNLGLPHPFDEKRTFFSWGGNATAFFVVWATFGTGYLVQVLVRRTQRARIGIAASAVRVLNTITPSRSTIGPSANEQTSLIE